MSVTIGKLVDDFITSPFEERDKTRDIEVVPRKMVEDIIEACLKRGKDCYDVGKGFDDVPDAQGRWIARSATWESAAQLAHDLLESFEKGEEA